MSDDFSSRLCPVISYLTVLHGPSNTQRVAISINLRHYLFCHHCLSDDILWWSFDIKQVGISLYDSDSLFFLFNLRLSWSQWHATDPHSTFLYHLLGLLFLRFSREFNPFCRWWRRWLPLWWNSAGVFWDFLSFNSLDFSLVLIDHLSRYSLYFLLSGSVQACINALCLNFCRAILILVSRNSSHSILRLLLQFVQSISIFYRFARLCDFGHTNLSSVSLVRLRNSASSQLGGLFAFLNNLFGRHHLNFFTLFKTTSFFIVDYLPGHCELNFLVRVTTGLSIVSNVTFHSVLHYSVSISSFSSISSTLLGCSLLDYLSCTACFAMIYNFFGWCRCDRL